MRTYQKGEVTGCVPYLKFHDEIIDGDGLCEEGGADSTLLIFKKLFLYKAQHETGFPDRRIA